MVARLTLSLFGPPREELASTVDGEVPEWIERLYESYGTTADSAPASASVLALGESLVYRLRKLSNRKENARQFGGTETSERSVEASLQWLARMQSQKGNWSAKAFGAGQVKGVFREAGRPVAEQGFRVGAQQVDDASALLAGHGSPPANERGWFTLYST